MSRPASAWLSRRYGSSVALLVLFLRVDFDLSAAGDEEEEITIFYDINPPQSDHHSLHRNHGLDTSFSIAEPGLVDESWTCPLLLSDPVDVQKEQPEIVSNGQVAHARISAELTSTPDAGLGPAPLMHRSSTSLGFRPSTASSGDLDSRKTS
jgi:hypothetical protein